MNYILEENKNKLYFISDIHTAITVKIDRIVVATDQRKLRK